MAKDGSSGWVAVLLFSISDSNILSGKHYIYTETVPLLWFV